MELQAKENELKKREEVRLLLFPVEEKLNLCVVVFLPVIKRFRFSSGVQYCFIHMSSI